MTNQRGIGCVLAPITTSVACTWGPGALQALPLRTEYVRLHYVVIAQPVF